MTEKDNAAPEADAVKEPVQENGAATDETSQEGAAGAEASETEADAEEGETDGDEAEAEVDPEDEGERAAEENPLMVLIRQLQDELATANKRIAALEAKVRHW